MIIHIESIPHKQQRYDTSGDYWLDKDGTVQVRVNQLKDEKEMLLVIFHELIEAFLTKQRNIKWEKIDKFDKEFAGLGEPGDDFKAPYHKEHEFATIIEYLLAEEFGVGWDKYTKDTSK